MSKEEVNYEQAEDGRIRIATSVAVERLGVCVTLPAYLYFHEESPEIVTLNVPPMGLNIAVKRGFLEQSLFVAHIEEEESKEIRPTLGTQTRIHIDVEVDPEFIAQATHQCQNIIQRHLEEMRDELREFGFTGDFSA